MQMSQSIAHIAGALSKFQGEVVSPTKTKTAIIPSKDPKKQGYKYKYADLGDIIDTIREPLKKHGLSYIQNPVRNDKGDLEGVYTMLLHESGEYMIFDPVPIRAGANATPQQVGSALTYARRYSLTLALGIAADEDDDAASATHGGNDKTNTKQQPIAQATDQTKSDDITERIKKGRQMVGTAASKKGLTREEKRAILKAETGKESSTDLSLEELQKMYKFFTKHDAADLKEMAMAHMIADGQMADVDAPITDEEVDAAMGGVA